MRDVKTQPVLNIKYQRQKLLVFFILFISFSTCSAVDEDKLVTDYFWNKLVSLKPPARPRVALVLGGGGARGMAHIGVIKVLEEEHIPVDIVVGTSVGALVGSLYAAGVPVAKIENMSENIGWDKLVNFSGPALVKMLITNQMLSTEKMEGYLAENIGNARFESMKKKFACVAADLITGERVILREGEVVPCVRASATIPGVFEPVEYRHRFLVDGGIVDNMPCDVAKLLDADFIIAVAVNGDFSRNKVNNVFMALAQSLYIQGKLLDETGMKNADIVIKPEVGEVTAADLGMYEVCIKSGIVATRKDANRIKKLILEKTRKENIFR